MSEGRKHLISIYSFPSYGLSECLNYLHCDESVIDHHLFRQEISSYCCFVLITKLLIDILIHQRGLPNSSEAERERKKERERY